MDIQTFKHEDEKYSNLWQDGYKDANWKRLANTVIRVATNHNRTYNKNPSIIDLGFGLGSAMNFFESRGIYTEGVEISSYAVEEQRKKGKKVYHSSLDNLKFLNNKQFNIGFCNDVIEHIPEELIIPSLDEITRVCSDYLFLSVCPTPSHHLSVEGENLHLTVKPKSWWEEKLKEYGELNRIKFLLSRSARYMVDLKSKSAS